MRTIFIASLLLLALSACSQPAQPPEPLRPALVYTVTAAGNSQAGVYSGEVHACREADLGFRVGGKITARLVGLGSTVKPGQILGRLDPQDAQFATAQARAQLAGAESEAANAASDLARAQKLVEQKFLSQAALDARINADKTARAKLAAMRAQFSISTNQSRYTALTADAAGVVTAVNFEAGQVVSPGQPVLRVAYAGDKEVQVRVGEAQARQLKVGAPVPVQLWSAPGKTYTGVIREVAPAADENRTYLVKVTLRDADDAVKLGMSASTAFSGVGVSTRSIALPPGALFQHGQQPAVWVVNAQHQLSALPVEVMQYRSNAILVRGALPAGSQVIAAGAHKLLAGQKIQPVPYDGVSPVGAGSRL